MASEAGLAVFSLILKYSFFMTSEQINDEISVYGWTCQNMQIFNRNGVHACNVSPFKKVRGVQKFAIKDTGYNILITGTMPGILHKALQGFFCCSKI